MLVNRDLAFAQDFKRDLVIESNTFGKGNFQSIVSLSKDTVLKLAITEYIFCKIAL
jgi:C-terminal processing protease CtpA/Prc